MLFINLQNIYILKFYKDVVPKKLGRKFYKDVVPKKK